MVAVSVGCEYGDGSRGSGVVSSAYDVLEMSVVRRGIGGVCEMCMCLARTGWEVCWDEWVSG